MNKKVVKGESVVLIDSAYRKIIIDTEDKTNKFKGVGVVDPISLVGKYYGKQLKIGQYVMIA